MTGDPEPITHLGIAQLSDLISSGALTSAQITEAILRTIREVDGHVEAFTEVLYDAAMDDAVEADRDMATNDRRSPLHGIPIAIKDMIDVAGVPTRCGSASLTDYVAPSDATVVGRLRDAGAIIVGKTVTHEFAYGDVSYPTKNPWKSTAVPGGSSGGSAAAVAANECPAALGTDTACSVRSPGALNGVVGMRPTQGRVSNHGVWPLSWSFDAVGPLARNSRDAALVLQQIAGFDENDPSTSDRAVPDFTERLGRPVEGMRIGIPNHYFLDDVQPQVHQAFDRSIETLRDMGLVPVEVDLIHARTAVACFLFIGRAESATFHEPLIRARGHLYGSDVLTHQQVGELILAKDYIKAQKARVLVVQDFKQALEKCDVIATPMARATAGIRQSPTDAPVDINGNMQGPFYASCLLGVPISVAGLPAISTPSGFSDEGLPIGLQIIGRPYDEATVFQVADAFEQATDWHKKRPKIAAAS